jgi:Leucine-rich repeat (LRR) protein
MSVAHLRHVADYLSPLSRATFRMLSPDLMESVAPSPHAVGVASHEFLAYLLRHKSVITHLTIYIESHIDGFIHMLPALERLEVLDIRASLDTELYIWTLPYLSRLRQVCLLGTSVRFPDGVYPNLESLRIISGTVAQIDFPEGHMPRLDTLSIEAHVLKSTITDLPNTITRLRFGVTLFPIHVLESICTLTAIRHLSFEGCRLTYLPEPFGELETLESLSLRGNFLTMYNSYGERDGVMLPIRGLVNLQYLDLSGNTCLELGSPSIQLPDNLRVLDVRSLTETMYNDDTAFYEGAPLDHLETLYTTHLPTRQDIQTSIQNLETIVYASPDRVVSPLEMLTTTTLGPLPDAFPEPCQQSGIPIPCSLDGVSINLGAPMAIRDVMVYADL